MNPQAPLLRTLDRPCASPAPHPTPQHHVALAVGVTVCALGWLLWFNPGPASPHSFWAYATTRPAFVPVAVSHVPATDHSTAHQWRSVTMASEHPIPPKEPMESLRFRPGDTASHMWGGICSLASLAVALGYFLGSHGARRPGAPVQGSHGPTHVALMAVSSGKPLGPQEGDAKIEFFMTPTCPYARRTWICLEEKGISYTTTPVDLSGDRTWYRQNINPLGKVPAIRHAASGAVIYESEIVNEFLEQQFPDSGASLMPADPVACARVRLWNVHHTNTLGKALFPLLSASDGDTASKLEELEAALEYYEANITGPYLCGEFSLADVNAMPIVDNLVFWTKEFMGYALPVDQFPKVLQWIAALQQRPSFVLTQQPEAARREAYHRLRDMMQKRAAGSPPSADAPPETCKQLWAERTGESFRDVAQVREIPVPQPGPGEALIKVRYAGVNGGCETFRARGEYAFKGNKTVEGGFPLGAEGAGMVVAVGEGVTAVKAGDAVAFLGGAFAEYVVCPASLLWVVPEASPEAAALRISALTACCMLEGTAQVQAGETVLVTAAGGGAGHFAVQFARLAGAHVVGTCSSPEKAQLLRELGCDRVINHQEEDLAGVLGAEYPRGFDVVFEGVGGAMLQVGLEHLAPEGRLIQIGYISEYPHNPDRAQEAACNDLDAAQMFWTLETVQRGRQTIYGGGGKRDAAAMAQSRARCLQLFQDGRLRAVVDRKRVFNGVESIVDAIEYMLTGQALGKVVVEMSGSE